MVLRSSIHVSSGSSSSISRGALDLIPTGHHSASSSSSRRRTPAPTPSEWSRNRKYAVIVDAGSSGSRMQVYSWVNPEFEKSDRQRTGKTLKELPTVEKGTWSGAGIDWQLKVEPGVSSFADHPQELPDYLRKLFAQAVDIIPPSEHSSTPVYFLATAGMRLLKDAERNEILRQTCSFIRTRTPFIVGNASCDEHVKVISGEEEGMLGWIAINYLMDGFKYKPESTLKEEIGLPTGTHGRTTFGFLDMGGASMQIAFEPSEPQPPNEENMMPVSLRMLDGTDVIHNVFVVTFLGYGANQAREQYMDLLLQNATTASTSLASSPASSAAIHDVADPCLPPGLKVPGPALVSHGITQSSFSGTGSFSSCTSAMSPLLDKQAACHHPPCLFHGVHVPKIDFSVNHFIGVSEYWYSSNDVFNLGGVYDFPKFQEAAEKFCATPWSSLLSSLKGGKVWGKAVTQDRLEKQCFKSAWLATVLHDGIGLPRISDAGGEGDGKPHADTAQDKADQKNLFQSMNDVHGLSVSWTLGKAVLESSQAITPSGKANDALTGEPAKTGADGGGGKNGKSAWPGIGQGAAPSVKTTRGQATYAVLGLLVLFLVYLCWSRSRRRNSRIAGTTPGLAALSPSRGRGGHGGGSSGAGGSGSGRSLLDRVSHALRGVISLKDASGTNGRGDYMLANMEEGADHEISIGGAGDEVDEEDIKSTGKLTPRPNGSSISSNGFGGASYAGAGLVGLGSGGVNGVGSNGSALGGGGGGGGGLGAANGGNVMNGVAHVGFGLSLNASSNQSRPASPLHPLSGSIGSLTTGSSSVVAGGSQTPPASSSSLSRVNSFTNLTSQMMVGNASGSGALTPRARTPRAGGRRIGNGGDIWAGELTSSSNGGMGS
ncbi:Golgi apyrase [Tilletia horrida]|uniref:Golgi apyrase n=1 Tax=Tilletia horrida TaxID=155126 RepID=A0AAN6GN29_9BASI|nr:Golgi apyrase [Tilletia horrida]KAK0547776.1 Golgi apyrase [Tilletia horrida]KAK0566923.1 Golgi apyrase [Tilletia horrida]